MLSVGLRGGAPQRLPTPGDAAAQAPAWSLQIADLRGAAGRILAEVPADNLSYNTPLCACGTFSASIPLDDRIAPQLDMYDLTEPGRRAVYILRDSVPMWGGIIWTSDYDSDNAAVKIAGADWWSYFDGRKILPVVGSIQQGRTDYIATLAVDLSGLEQNALARALVELAQDHTGGDIGVVADASATGVFRDGMVWYGYDLAAFGEALKELVEIDGGPDLRFSVRQGAGGIERVMLLGEPDLGQVGSPHVWEYGMSVAGYSWPRDASGMATRAFALGDGQEQGQPIAVAEDDAAYASGWPLLETETSYTTVRESGDLDGHALADQAAHRAPIVLPTLRLAPGIGPQLGEYASGDDARLIINDRYQRFDGRVRIQDVQVSYSASAGEQVTVVCMPRVDGSV